MLSWYDIPWQPFLRVFLTIAISFLMLDLFFTCLLCSDDCAESLLKETDILYCRACGNTSAVS